MMLNIGTHKIRFEKSVIEVCFENKKTLHSSFKKTITQYCFNTKYLKITCAIFLHKVLKNNVNNEKSHSLRSINAIMKDLRVKSIFDMLSRSSFTVCFVLSILKIFK